MNNAKKGMIMYVLAKLCVDFCKEIVNLFDDKSDNNLV